VLLLIGEDMTEDMFYQPHVETYECEVFGGINTNNVPMVKSIVYHSDCDVLNLNPMPESNGYSWRMEVVSHNPYVLKRVGETVLNSDLAEYARIVDPRAEEKIKQYIV